MHTQRMNISRQILKEFDISSEPLARNVEPVLESLSDVLRVEPRKLPEKYKELLEDSRQDNENFEDLRNWLMHSGDLMTLTYTLEDLYEARKKFKEVTIK